MKKILLIGLVIVLNLGLISCTEEPEYELSGQVTGYNDEPLPVEVQITHDNIVTTDEEGKFTATVEEGYNHITISKRQYRRPDGNIGINYRHSEGYDIEEDKEIDIQVYPNFYISDFKKGYSGSPGYFGSFNNWSGSSVYNVAVEFTIYDSENKDYIIDTAKGYPADLGDIGHDQAAGFDAIAYDLSNTDQLEYFDISVSYLD